MGGIPPYITDGMVHENEKRQALEGFGGIPPYIYDGLSHEESKE